MDIKQNKDEDSDHNLLFVMKTGKLWLDLILIKE